MNAALACTRVIRKIRNRMERMNRNGMDGNINFFDFYCIQGSAMGSVMYGTHN